MLPIRIPWVSIHIFVTGITISCSINILVLPNVGLAPRESTGTIFSAGFELLLAVNLGLLSDLGGRLGGSNFGGHCAFDGPDVEEVMPQILNSLVQCHLLF